MKRSLVQFLSTLITAIVVVAVLAVAALAASVRVRHGKWSVPQEADLTIFVRDTREAFVPPPSRVIYLERAEITVLGGSDDAAASESSLLPAGKRVTVPRYAVSNATWKRLVTCVESKFAAFDVVVTDTLPKGQDYLLVKVGGTPADIGIQGRELGGIAPYNGRAIPNSIVFVFDQKGQFRTKNNCETAAHEIGHVYGLDHSFQCGDVMTYKQGCGKKVFKDQLMPCGEDKQRDCRGAQPTQNSWGQLLAVLGPIKA
jgi:hypothetical protein